MQVHSLIDSFNFAIEGLIHAFKTQRNMKIHFAIALLVLFGSIFFNVSKFELIILFFSIAFVIAMEMVNTAIEVVIDMISEEYRIRAKIAKDLAAGAVLMAAVNAILVGYLIFIEDLRRLNLGVINHIKQEPAHLIFVTLGLLIIIIIALKARQEKGSPLQGGMPSGHSAISFSMATIVTLLTGDIIVITLVYLLALLVVQSRLQTKTHNIVEVIAGGLIGVLTTIIIFYFF